MSSVRFNGCILLYITGSGSHSAHVWFLLLFNHFAAGSDPSSGCRQKEIMQPDNASRQSITLIASTMMPVRFRTNFKLLKLSICTAGSKHQEHKEWKECKCPKTKELLCCCFFFCFQAARLSTVCYCLFSSASEHSDEMTTSPTALLLSSWQAIQILAWILPAHSLCSVSLALFLSGFLHFHYFPSLFLLSLSLSFTIQCAISHRPSTLCQVSF